MTSILGQREYVTLKGWLLWGKAKHRTRRMDRIAVPWSSAGKARHLASVGYMVHAKIFPARASAHRLSRQQSVLGGSRRPCLCPSCPRIGWPQTLSVHVPLLLYEILHKFAGFGGLSFVLLFSSFIKRLNLVHTLLKMEDWTFYFCK
jgi:hypothetical protein